MSTTRSYPSLNGSVSLLMATKPNLSPGSSPPLLGAATSDQATKNEASPPPSTNAASAPPPPTSSSPPPSQPSVLNSPPSNPQTSQPPTLPVSPHLKSSTTSPPPSSSNPSPVPDQKQSPPSPVQSSPPTPTYNSLIPPTADGKFVAPPLPVGLQPPPSPPGQLAGPLSPPIANVRPATSDPPTFSSNWAGPRVISPPISGGSPSGHSSPTSPGAKSNNTPGSPHGNGNGFPNSGAVIGGAAVGVLLFALIVVLFIRRRKRQQKAYNSHCIPPKNFTVKKEDGYHYGQQQQPVGFSGPKSHSPHSSWDGYGSHNESGVDSDIIGSSKSFFSYKELMEMTNGFARENILGQGGFGCVYKGWMPDGKVVAVKQLKTAGGQGDREFKAEVEIISRIHHRHLVSLVGYCISENQRSLIYEFVPNKTLDHHLHEKGLPVLEWPNRLKIAIGSAKGLAYLHEDCHPKIFHRDIKSENILLDDAFEAKVADFGLARLNDTTQSHVLTRVMGTFGYMAPEYASSGQLTDKSDVFSFGVVLLELITGRKPVDRSRPLGRESLVEWARPFLTNACKTHDLSELVDPRLGKHYMEGEMFRMIETAAACVHHSALNRPCMVQVVRALDSDAKILDLSNGVGYGQSTAYGYAQYNEDIERFRRTALGSIDSPEFDTFNGESVSRDASHGPLTCSDYTSGESDTQAMYRPGNYRFT